MEQWGITLEQRDLQNGTHIGLFQKKGMPVYLRALFKAGSRYDPVGREGLAHFTEHMIAAGTKNYPSKDKLAERIERFGGIFGAYTSPEEMAINIEIADKTDIKVAGEIFCEMLTRPLFSKKIVETERGSILKELGEYKSNPARWLWVIWRQLVFQHTELGRLQLGSENDIKEIGIKDLKNYYQTSLTAGNLSLIVAGDIEMDEVEQMVRTQIDLPQSGDKITKPVRTVRENYILIEKYTTSDQIHFVLSFRTPSKFDPIIPTIDIISTVLGGGRAATLSKKLRYEKGLVYSVFARSLVFSSTGSWIISSSTSKKSISEVLQIIGEEINRVREFGLSEEEVSFAKDKITKSVKRQLQTAESWVDFHDKGELYLPQSYMTLDNYLAAIQKVEPQDTKNVASQYFGNDQWYLTACGDITADQLTFHM